MEATKTKKLTFSEIREIIIEKCKEQSACEPEFKKLLAAKNETDFWTVIKNNGSWSVEHGVISIELFEKYDIDRLNENHIYIDGKKREIEKGILAINFNCQVSKNNGTVSYNGNNGTVSKNYGTVYYNGNYGIVYENYGTVSKNNGTVSENYGTVSENYGPVSENNGTVSENNGTGVVIEKQNRKIYIKKGEFEIIYL